MALPSTNVGELRTTATANMVNGVWFDSALGGTDYTLQDAAQVTGTDGTSNASTNFNSASATFTSAMVGNCIHLTAGTNGTVGWYSIRAYVDANNVTLDRNCSTAAMTNGTFYLGGAGSLSSTLDDDFFETAVAGNIIYMKKPASGTFTLGETVNIAASGGTQNPIKIIGYETTRGDNPTGTGRPTIACAANSFTLGTNWYISNIIFTGTGSNIISAGTGGIYRAIKSINSSSTAGRNAFLCVVNETFMIGNEFISYRGQAYTTANNCTLHGNYLHHSNIGLLFSNDIAVNTINSNIISSNVANAISATTAFPSRNIFINNTLVGTPNKLGTGISLVTGTTDLVLLNNIIYGFVTGVSHADAGQAIGFDDYNCYNNNTTDVTNWTKGSNDITTAPAFTDFVERSGTTASTSATNILTQTGATFQTWGITAGTDFVYLTGAGITAGIYGILSVDSETQITVDVSLTAGASNITWSITTGHDFLQTADLSQGTPQVFPGGLTTGDAVIGAVIPTPSAGGGGMRLAGSGGLASGA